MATDYAGIDYGRGLTNRDLATGIHYGVIPQHEVLQAWADSSEADYGDPTCPECGSDVVDANTDLESSDEYEPYGPGCTDYICQHCRHTLDSSDVYGDEPIAHNYTADGYNLHAGSDGDIFVLESPYYTHAQFCSPCAPGAGYLLNPCESGPKTYALGHDWFEDGRAPYPVFRVSDDVPIPPPIGDPMTVD
jgi:hypothetical protein